MKNKMRKLVGAVISAALLVTMSFGVLAAPSPAVSGTVSKVNAATDANGNAVEVKLAEVPAQYAEAVAQIKNVDTLKEVLGSAFVEGMSVVDVKEVTVPEGTTFPVTITFAVPGVTAGTKVAVLHYNGSAWEVVESTAGNGTITATFTSLSPVAFVVDKNTASSSTAAKTTSTSSTSPKTGESSMVVVAGMLAMIAAAGACGLKKKEFNR